MLQEAMTFPQKLGRGGVAGAARRAMIRELQAIVADPDEPSRVKLEAARLLLEATQPTKREAKP